MKKVVSFNVGDKVFAKVKGYPAWPAMIIEDQTTKFNVRFYGTGETGIVKSKDLFYYLKHKKNFMKSLKRKDYNEAIEEIELAIKECGGTDGNRENVDSPAPPENIEDSGNGKNKRKRSVSTDKANGNPTKKLSEENTSNNDGVPEVSPNEKVAKKTVPERSPRKLKTRGSSINKEAKEQTAEISSVKETDKVEKSKADEEENKSKKLTEENKSKKLTEENESLAVDEQKLTKNVLTAANLKIVTEDYLKAIVSYGDSVKKDESKYKDKPIESREQFDNEVFLTKIPSGKYIGIKYNRDVPPPLTNEFERAMYDANEAKTVLSLKKLLEDGTCKPESDENTFICNISINEKEIDEIKKARSIEHKKNKIAKLKIESNVIELDAKIKECLGLDKAQPKEAVEYLDEFLCLNIKPLMLKKHPHVVEMVKRLGRYIGNVSEWDLTKEQHEEFEIEAEKVRKKAEELCKKFGKLFNVPSETSLWNVFTEEVEEFKEQVKDLSESTIFALTSEPGSRQFFLDNIEDAEETITLVANQEEDPKDDNI